VIRVSKGVRRAERKAGGQERAFHRVVGGDVHPLAVAECAGAVLGGEEEVAQRLVDHAGDGLAVLAQPDRDTPHRKVLEVVRRAVERVDDPRARGLAVARAAALLAQEPVVGTLLADRGHDGLLALAVGIGDPVVARLEVRVLAPEVLPVAEQDGGALSRGVNGEIEVVHPVADCKRGESPP